LLNILVTGSSGYIGSSFISKFGANFNISTFSLLHQSLDQFSFDDVDVILHCAALVHQRKKHSYQHYYKINTQYTLDLARKAKENGVKHFIFISTLSVYSPDLKKIDEDSPCIPQTSYGKSKYEAENQLNALNDDNFMISIIRPAMVYGKGALGNIQHLIKLVKTLRIIPLGKIQNKRSFIYIDNLCYLLNEIIKQNKEGIFLACDDDLISSSELLQLIANGLDRKIYLIKIPLINSLLKYTVPSIYKKIYCDLEVSNIKTKKTLSLKLPFKIRDGIKRMMYTKNITKNENTV